MALLKKKSKDLILKTRREQFLVLLLLLAVLGTLVVLLLKGPLAGITQAISTRRLERQESRWWKDQCPSCHKNSSGELYVP